MADTAANDGITRALVLGGGGIAGVAWEAGILTGLRRGGVELGTADVIVGTSAGSIVGTLLASGADLEEAVAEQRELAATAGPAPAAVDMTAVMDAFAILFDTSIEPAEARRRVGQLALAAPVGEEKALIDRIGQHFAIREWPDRRLLVTAVDTETGELTVWDRESGADLLPAVTSSCAVPCVFPAVTIAGRRYMDGGVRSGTDADLAAGADRLVILEPMAHVMPREPLDREVATVGPDAVATIGPDQTSAEIFGTDLLSPTQWGPAFDAGVAQAARHVEEIRLVWA
jgi:NTE family protein